MMKKTTDPIKEIEDIVDKLSGKKKTSILDILKTDSNHERKKHKETEDSDEFDYAEDFAEEYEDDFDDEDEAIDEYDDEIDN